MAEFRYEVSFQGVASTTLRAAFLDCELSAGSGLTLVRCRPSSLQDVIRTIEDLGLQLLDIRLIAEHPDQHGHPAS